MKKTVLILATIIGVLALNKNEPVVIPKEAIRFRIIANSNKNKDQQLKKTIINSLTKDIKKLELSNDINESRNNIKNSLPNISNNIKNTLKKENSQSTYDITYGENYFPKKQYKGVIYPSGNYESVVIKLGEAKGNNFWCVLFPPLCLLDKEETKTNNIEYTSFVKEIINKYF